MTALPVDVWDDDSQITFFLSVSGIYHNFNGNMLINTSDDSLSMFAPFPCIEHSACLHTEMGPFMLLRNALFDYHSRKRDCNSFSTQNGADYDDRMALRCVLSFHIVRLILVLCPESVIIYPNSSWSDRTESDQ